MKELISLPSVTSIYFSDKPLPLCGINAVTPLPLKEINQRLSEYRRVAFTWTNNILIPDDWVMNAIDQMKLEEIAEKMVLDDSLCVCFMDEETGYGVYTLRPVKQGSILLYSGIIKKFAYEKLYYGMQAGQDYIVDGRECSGFADLFQDLYEPSIDPMEFSGAASNNFTAKTLSLSCGGIPLLEANKDIPALTQCGVSYGIRFWDMQERLHHKRKQFYSLQGDIISHFQP